MEARALGKEATMHRLTLYLKDIFPPQGGTRGVPSNIDQMPVLRRREARRKEYAATQNLRKRDRRRCVVSILEGLNNIAQPPQAFMEPYWTTVMKATSDASPHTIRTTTINDLWKPIKGDELLQGQIPVSTAAGPDGVSARLWRSVPTPIILKIYNLLIWCRRLPQTLLRSRTVFLPKEKDARESADFRPTPPSPPSSSFNHPLHHHKRFS